VGVTQSNPTRARSFTEFALVEIGQNVASFLFMSGLDTETLKDTSPMPAIVLTDGLSPTLVTAMENAIIQARGS
jgi:hypothetical protein